MIKKDNPLLSGQNKKIIVLGVGNPILGDDGVGIKIVRQLKGILQDYEVDIDEASTGGLSLLDMMKGYHKSILIDAIKSPQDSNGSIKRLTMKDLCTTHSSNPHDMGLHTAIQLAEQMGEKIPREIVVIGIVVNTPPCFSDHLTPLISQAVPKAIELVLQEIPKP